MSGAVPWSPALQRDEACFPHSLLGHLGDQQGPVNVPAAASSNVSCRDVPTRLGGVGDRQTIPACGSQSAETLQTGIFLNQPWDKGCWM